jgi:protein-L-isoaspartate(D-aspartate) O-methyltransferase
MDRRNRDRLTSALEGSGMTSRRTRERLVSRLRDKGIKNADVLTAIAGVPRHLFVDEALASRAYEDTALPIGSGQTISQPYVVAKMSEAVLREREPLKRVLEVGTGCGYQTAVLAKLAQKVFTIERIEALLFKAREHLHLMRINNVRSKHGDGYAGWPQQAPFDAIVVTAAPPELPQDLVHQLAEGGRLIIPVGAAGGQDLLLVERTAEGFEQRIVERVSFVPLLKGLT